jgi:putative ATP-dependent endonuclease of OLD family
MHLTHLSIENFRCFGEGPNRLDLPLRKGLTALVGENDSGKSAIIDALRFALGTIDQEWYRLEDSDFHVHTGSREIKITCKYEGLAGRDLRAFVEFLTYGTKEGEGPFLYVNWTAKDTGEIRKGRPYRRVEVHSGENGEGPSMPQEVRELLQATYLRPLRDAERALSAGRGSRLAQVLEHSAQITSGSREYDLTKPLNDQELSVLGISDLLNALLQQQKGVTHTRDQIDKNLTELTLQGDGLTSDIRVSGVAASEESRLRELLEKLDLRLGGDGKLGLGSNNALFMACELLLLAQPDEGSKVLLIEEPEAHLHAQRQLRVMKFLQEQARDRNIQVIVTTHSPTLASAIDLDNIVMVTRQKRAFAMAEGHTELEKSDYRFLQRFLDATKANLFFARGVMIVEGDAENILIPTLACLLGRDFTTHGVSIVNVGGVGLRRYARIFLRRDTAKDGMLGVPVACVTDMDVMPDCAPVILGKVKAGENWPEKAERRWKAKKDFEGDGLKASRQDKESKASGQCVMTFVADEWTLEYDLALGPKGENGQFSGGLAEDVFTAAHLARCDEQINAGKKSKDDVAQEAEKKFSRLLKKTSAQGGCSKEEILASLIYAEFTLHDISKPVAAQYLAERLIVKIESGKIGSDELRNRLPRYLTSAINHVTGEAEHGPRE